MKKKRIISPYFKIIVSFLGVILIGTCLLLLPFSTNDGNGLRILDSFFITVSSVCVTGLSTIGNLGDTLSIFGKIVLCLLMEIGGLSFLTITVFFVVSFKMKLGVAGSFAIKESLNQDSLKDLGKLVKKIVILALSVQLVGGILNTIILFFHYNNFSQALGIGFFHAISSFNNAGLDIFGTDSSMLIFASNIPLNIVTMILIVTGGIGFVVILDVIDNKKWKRLALNTKIVLVTTTTLIVGGAILIKCGNINGMTFLEAIFTSVTARTAGFSTINMAEVTNAVYVIVIFLMFIGASSGSTGGGIKTSSLFIIINVLINYTRGKVPHAFKRKIGDSLIIKTFCLVFFALIFIISLSTIICMIEGSKFDVKYIIFEVVSAFSTTGLSMGITSSLTVASKLLICLAMFVGRIGPLTFMATLNKGWLVSSKEKVGFVEERIMVG